METTQMKTTWKLAAAALATAAFLTACGGGGAGNQTPKVTFSSMVNFGDSLSDVGSYKVGAVAALGGGKYTVNSATAKNWTELVAAQYGLAAPCAAVTGLDGSPQAGFFAPVTQNTNCSNYAQGGSRVTNPVGPGNKLLGGGNAILGQLTIPVKSQIENHLARNGGSFKGTELVTVMAGGNDIFIQAGSVAAYTEARVRTGTPLAQATNEALAQAVTEMGKAGAEKAGYVKALIAGKGAKYIAVVNLPNVSVTPYALSQDANAQAFVKTMVETFNAQLANGLKDVPGVIIADAYTESTTQARNPAPYGLSNVTSPACSATGNPLGRNALTCNTGNVVSGDVSRYQYADDVHPTPFGYELLAKFVLSEMLKAGWL
jgi:outer membrane lipase/esterase